MEAIGLDVVATERITGSLKKYGEKFARKILGPREYEIFVNRKNNDQFLAGRFACKEAVIKALGKFLTDRPSFPSLQIVNDPTGQPELILPDEVKAKLSGHKCLVTISHEKNVAAAVAVILEEK